MLVILLGLAALVTADTVEYYECMNPGEIPCHRDSDCCGSAICARIRKMDMIVGHCLSRPLGSYSAYPPTDNGRKRSSSPCKEYLIRLSMSQLRYLEQLLGTLDDEVQYMEASIRGACEGKCQINCSETRCSLNSILQQLEEVKCNLMKAFECYDPVKDCCEYNFTCTLLELLETLNCCVSDLIEDLDCLEGQDNTYPKPCCVKRPTFKSYCKKDCNPCNPCNPCKSPSLSCKTCCIDGKSIKTCCVTRPSQCEPDCCRPQGLQQCKPRNCGPKEMCCPKIRPRCNGTSTIPVGVLLMKL